MIELLHTCPVCNSNQLSDYLTITDYFLSGEQFAVQQCRECDFKFINPRPSFNEIHRYYRSDDYISHNSQKKNLISRAYRVAREYNLTSKLKLIKKQGEVRSLLDIGCGTGEFLLKAQRSGIQCVGIEPTDQAKSYARNVNHLEVYSSLNECELPEKSLDCITMWHVLEHVHDLDLLFSKVTHWINPSGHFIVAVPNCRSWDAEHYKEHWAAWDVPRHLYHFEERTLVKLALKYGFRCKSIVPQKLDSFYVSLLSEKYKKKQGTFPKAIINGLRSNIAAMISKRGYSSQIFILMR